MKLADIALFVGAALILVPPVFDLPIRGWSYYLFVCVGAVLCAISGYNAQAKMTGLGEPGEDILRRTLLWLKVKILRRRG